LPNNLTFTQAFKAAGRSYPDQAQSQGLLYRPVLLAQADIRFLNRKYGLDYEKRQTALVYDPDRRGVVRWEEHLVDSINPSQLDSGADPRARFITLDAPLNDARLLKPLESDYKDWVYRSSSVTVRANEKLKIYAGPDVPQAEFRRMCAEAAREERDEEIDKVEASFEKKIERIEDRLEREQRELREDQSEHSQRKMEELGTHAETVFSLFTRRRRSLSTSLSKRRMTEKAKADVEESLDAIEDLKRDLDELGDELSEALEEVNQKWSDIADDMTEITVTPYKKDILVDLFGVAWVPYHLVQVGEETVDLPGYGQVQD
jgi:type II secretory pathway component PulJ